MAPHARALTCLAAALLAGCAATSRRFDPLSLDPETFGRELHARFQSKPPEPSPPEVADQAKGQALDARYFAAFPELDRSYTPAARDAARELAHELVEDAATLSHEAFVLRVAQITALADNGHTTVGENAWRKNTPRLPLRSYWFADGLYVVRASRQQIDLLGARIDAIDGHAVEDIFQGLRRYEGGTEMHRRLRLLPLFESPRFLRAAGIGREDHALTLSGALANGERFERRVEAQDRDRSAPVSSSSRLLFASDPDGPEQLASLYTLDSKVPVYLRDRLHLFMSYELPENGLYVALGANASSEDESITDFLAGVLEQCARLKPSFVVVDFRMNGGGDYTKTYPFVVALDELMRDKGRIYALTSGWTFSAAITTVAALKTFGRDIVTIVGEPVGDRLDFWAEGERMELLNAYVAAYFTTGRHVYNGPCNDIDCFWVNRLYPVRVDTLDPDIPATLTFADYRDGRDPALEAVLTREREGPAADGTPSR
ncbi:MAG TPA: hypothetical protein VFE23_11440 [Usitatibacter sp.]|jgi:hypothetical protein|nr:hypothetical protein [Usitatibacter sp.]